MYTQKIAIIHLFFPFFLWSTARLIVSKVAIMKIIMMKKIGSHYSLSIKQKSMNILVKLVQVLNCYMWDTNRIVLFSCMFCFPIPDDVIVPQRIVSFICRLMHVHPCAYVCIINEKTKGNFHVGEHYVVWIGKTKQTYKLRPDSWPDIS